MPLPRTDSDKLRFLASWVRDRDALVIESLNGDPNITIDNYFPENGDSNALGSEVADDLDRIAVRILGEEEFMSSMVENSRQYSKAVIGHANAVGWIGGIGYAFVVLAIMSWSLLSIVFAIAGVAQIAYSYARQKKIKKNSEELHDKLQGHLETLYGSE